MKNNTTKNDSIRVASINDNYDHNDSPVKQLASINDISAINSCSNINVSLADDHDHFNTSAHHYDDLLFSPNLHSPYHVSLINESASASPKSVIANFKMNNSTNTSNIARYTTATATTTNNNNINMNDNFTNSREMVCTVDAWQKKLFSTNNYKVNINNEKNNEMPMKQNIEGVFCNDENKLEECLYLTSKQDGLTYFNNGIAANEHLDRANDNSYNFSNIDNDQILTKLMSQTSEEKEKVQHIPSTINHFIESSNSINNRVVINSHHNYSSTLHSSAINTFASSGSTKSTELKSTL
jgi:hypothetical protein